GRHRLRRAGGDGAARPEEAGRLLVRRAPRLRDARTLRLHGDVGGGERLSDAEPRSLDRRALPPGRDDLRAPPHATDRRLRGVVERRPRVRELLPRGHARLRGAARTERVHRRVPDPPRSVRAPTLGNGRGDERSGARGPLPPLDVPAGHLRPPHASGERRSPGPERQGDRGSGAGARPLLRDGALPGALLPAHGAVDQQDAGPHAGPGSHGDTVRRGGGPSMTAIAVAASTAHWQVALPGLIVAATAMLVMATDMVVRDPDAEALPVLGITGLAAAAAAAAWLWGAAPVGDGFASTLRADRYALFFTVLLCAGSALTILMSVEFLREHPLPRGEYFALVLLATTGMIFLAAANDLIVLFLALEIMSLAVYVLTGMLRAEPRSVEAALKYFLLGAFATGFLLYGIAFFYAAAG